MNNDNQPPGDGSDAAALRIEAELRDRYGLLLKTSEVAEVLRLSAASILQIPRDQLPRGDGRGPRARFLASDVAAYVSRWTKNQA